MHVTRRATWLVILILATAGCANKHAVAAPASFISGETGKAGAKLAYEHHLRIELPDAQIAPRVAAVREACESARFGACNVLSIEQSEHSGALTLRVVPAGVEPLATMAGQNGKLAWRQTHAEDLADAVQDNDQKLKQLDAYSAQMEQLSQRKDLSPSDLIALGHERAQIQVERENLQNVSAQQQRRIDTNLLELDFVEEGGGHHLGISLDSSIDQLYEGIRDALQMLAYGIPFLLLAFPLALGWRWVWRRITRKSRERDMR
ncbi:DUF4349 domain-containing protein [Dyella mobilis]|uniref:DUF4349 domain-containing protein n=1 Tax=Dyella mobilis TaxID=1849582 RepID=A0ABS2KF82_9GAMM|nr:DUF4349 domain-containing protein [Dyella mobilis]MBM7129598.1 DUF4349 domain-containing protein [Dyella mobilis]GLQ98138.1 hypothetical protein GCM10007863_25580 [Dyella mobilis]